MRARQRTVPAVFQLSGMEKLSSYVYFSDVRTFPAAKSSKRKIAGTERTVFPYLSHIRLFATLFLLLSLVFLCSYKGKKVVVTGVLARNSDPERYRNSITAVPVLPGTDRSRPLSTTTASAPFFTSQLRLPLPCPAAPPDSRLPPHFAVEGRPFCYFGCLWG